jgi:hypothetical protein
MGGQVGRDGCLSWEDGYLGLVRWVAVLREMVALAYGEGWLYGLATESLWVRIQISLKTQMGYILQRCSTQKTSPLAG